jgi:hypothetical protein
MDRYYQLCMCWLLVDEVLAIEVSSLDLSFPNLAVMDLLHTPRNRMRRAAFWS